MRSVEDKPHVMDDATMNRVIKLYTEQLQDHWLYGEQFARWRKRKLSGEDEAEVNRLIKQVIKLKEINEEILTIEPLAKVLDLSE